MCLRIKTNMEENEMKKWIALLLCIVMIMALAAGCKAPAAETTTEESAAETTADTTAVESTEPESALPEGEVILTYQTPSATDMITNAWAAYQQLHPDYKLDVQVVDNAEIGAKTLAQASTNTLCDFSWNNGSQWTDISRQTDAIMDLTDIVNNEIGADKFVADTFVQLGVDGKIWALPAEMQIQGFLVNTAVFEELNLEVPTNWAELVACAQTFRDNGKVLIGSGTGDTWPTWPYYNWLQLWGVEDLKEDLFATHTLNWADSDVINAYYKLAELKEIGAFPDNNSTLTYEMSKTMLLAGECGIIPTSTDQLTGITGGEEDLAGHIKYWFGIAFEDSPYDQSLSVKIVNNGYGIAAGLEEDKLAVLIDFFKFFYSADGANAIIKDGLMLPITDEITADITPLTQSIVELTQDPARTAVKGASYSWWDTWNLRFDCEAALYGFHLEGHEYLMNGLIDGSLTKDDIPGVCAKMDEAIDEAIAWIAANPS